jgi:hypothetical protein
MRRTRIALVVGLLVWHVAVGHVYARAWASDVALWAHALAMNPDSERARVNLDKARAGW